MVPGLPRSVYLDQNAWIDLFKQKEGKTNDPRVQGSLDKVISSSREGSFAFPLSLVHFMELSHIRDEKKRLGLSGFMYGISRGYGIYPLPVVTRLEVRRLVRTLGGAIFATPRPVVIGKGIGYVMGGQPSVSYAAAPPVEVRSLIQRIIDDPGMIRWALRNKGFIEYMRQMRKSNLDYVTRIEKDRRTLPQIKDAKLRRDFDMSNYLMGDVLSRFVEAAIELRLDRSLAPRLSNQHDVETFVRRIPSAYALWTLSYRRDVHFDRSIKGNDLLDLIALSVAIPHCDVVVTERFWTSIARQTKLDKVNNVTILQSVKDLGSALCT